MKESGRRGVSVGPSRVQVITVDTTARTELKDVTAEVAHVVKESGVENGLCHLYVPHTTAGLVINESDDPDVAVDIGETLNRLVPASGKYRHYEGNADSHVKSALVGVSEIIPIESGRLLLGRWQGIFFCEFDGPRRRELRVKIVAD